MPTRCNIKFGGVDYFSTFVLSKQTTHMIITQKEQMDLVTKYLDKKGCPKKATGYMDGMLAALKLVDNKLKADKVC